MPSNGRFRGGAGRSSSSLGICRAFIRQREPLISAGWHVRNPNGPERGRFQRGGSSKARSRRLTKGAKGTSRGEKRGVHDRKNGRPRFKAGTHRKSILHSMSCVGFLGSKDGRFEWNLSLRADDCAPDSTKLVRPRGSGLDFGGESAASGWVTWPPGGKTIEFGNLGGVFLDVPAVSRVDGGRKGHLSSLMRI